MIATLIVTHPARIHWAEELAADTGGTIVLDTDGLGAGGNHRRALEVGIDTGADHLLVLEDDALPVPGLLGHVERAIEHRPNQILGLYVGNLYPRAHRVDQAVEEADRVGASWLTYTGLMWGVATVWPRLTAAMFLEHDHSTHLWDIHVRAWCQRNRHEVAYCWPSLVDHRDTDSVIERTVPKDRGRTARRVGVPTWNDITVAMK